MISKHAIHIIGHIKINKSHYLKSLLFQKVTDMPRRHIGQLAKDGIALFLVEGEGLKTGGFQMVVGDALALGVLLHGAKLAGPQPSLRRLSPTQSPSI